MASSSPCPPCRRRRRRRSPGRSSPPAGTVLRPGAVSIAALIKVETGTLVSRVRSGRSPDPADLASPIGYDPALTDPAATYVVKGGIVDGAAVWQNREGVPAIQGGIAGRPGLAAGHPGRRPTCRSRRRRRVPERLAADRRPSRAPASPSPSAPAPQRARSPPTRRPTRHADRDPDGDTDAHADADPDAHPDPDADPDPTPDPDADAHGDPARPRLRPRPRRPPARQPRRRRCAAATPITGHRGDRHPDLQRAVPADRRRLRDRRPRPRFGARDRELHRRLGDRPRHHAKPVPFELDLRLLRHRSNRSRTRIQATIVDGENAWVTAQGRPGPDQGQPVDVDITLTYRPDLRQGHRQRADQRRSASSRRPSLRHRRPGRSGDRRVARHRRPGRRATGSRVAFAIPYAITDIDPANDYVVTAEVVDAASLAQRCRRPGHDQRQPEERRPGRRHPGRRVAEPEPDRRRPCPSPAPRPAPVEDTGGGNLLGIIILIALIGAVAAFLIARGRGQTDAVPPAARRRPGGRRPKVGASRHQRRRPSRPARSRRADAAPRRMTGPSRHDAEPRPGRVPRARHDGRGDGRQPRPRRVRGDGLEPDAGPRPGAGRPRASRSPPRRPPPSPTPTSWSSASRTRPTSRPSCSVRTASSTARAPGTLVIDCSTIAPSGSWDFAARLARARPARWSTRRSRAAARAPGRRP